MDNLEASFAEHERIERLKALLKKQGRLLVTLLVVLLLGVGLFQYWQHYQARRSDAAAQLYMQLLAATEKSNQATQKAVASDLMAHYASSPYASVAAFAMSQLALKAHKTEEAEKSLQWVIDHGDQAFLIELARIRLAQIFLHQKQAESALKVLAGAGKVYPTQTAVFKGQAFLLEGQSDLARAEFQKALDATPAESNMRSVVEMYLNDV